MCVWREPLDKGIPSVCSSLMIQQNAHTVKSSVDERCWHKLYALDPSDFGLLILISWGGIKQNDSPEFETLRHSLVNSPSAKIPTKIHMYNLLTF